MERREAVVVLRLDVRAQGGEVPDDFDAPGINRRPMERGVADVVCPRLDVRAFGMEIGYGAVDKLVAHVPLVFHQVLPYRVLPVFRDEGVGLHLLVRGQNRDGILVIIGFFCADQGSKREAAEARTNEAGCEAFAKVESRLHNEAPPVE